MASDPQALAFAALDRLAGGLPALGLAVSGGGDSTALMHLAAGWAAARGCRLAAVTVDHGLRPESAAEAAAAGRAAAAMGVPHSILRWDGPAAAGNLAAQAREARLALIGGWARDAGLPAVALGHTRDDVAETLLMRLNRGAGLEGLAAMTDRREAAGMVWLRPLLGIGRAELRDMLRACGAGWVDDPSNDDPRRDRARVRAAMTAAGLDPARLADSARHLAAARGLLGRLALQAVAGGTMAAGDLTLPDAAAAEPELRRMILTAAVATVTGAAYPPRHAATAQAMATLTTARKASLGGALITRRGGDLLIGREPAAAARAPDLTADGVWDDRWRIVGLPPGGAIRARPDTAQPALWRGHVGPLDPAAAGVSAVPLRQWADFARKLAPGVPADPAVH